MEDYLEVECQDCFWQGDSQDLESATEALNDTDYIHCPECAGTDITNYEHFTES